MMYRSPGKIKEDYRGAKGLGAVENTITYSGARQIFFFLNVVLDFCKTKDLLSVR